MCLILFSWNAHPKYKLILAANRDEFYARPTAEADFWKESPQLVAGKDLEAGGTWLGLEKTGRIAAVTNYRDLSSIKAEAISRGFLTRDFLLGDQNPPHYLNEISKNKDRYNGFNLIVGDLKELYYYSNIQDQITALESGVHGLSNHFLNTPWPKVELGKKLFKQATNNYEILTDDLFLLLSNVDKPADNGLPDTGISRSLERTLSSIFIKSPDYGTYSSTVLLVTHDGEATFEERSYNKKGSMRLKNLDLG